MTKATDNKIEALQLDINQVTRGKSILNANQIQKIFNSTPKRYQYSRPAKGGGNWTYVRKSYVRKVLDSVFGFNWDFEVSTSVQEAYEVAKTTGSVVVKGTLVTRNLDDKLGLIAEVRKTDFGRSEVKFKKEKDDFGQRVPLDFGNDMKAAASDCLKRCAAQWGIAADIYEAEEFMQIEITGSDENSERTKNTQAQIKKAKKLLAKKATEVKDEKTKP